MLTKPTNWDSYLADSNHYYETVLRVGSTEYDQDDIMSLTASQNLYGDEYSLGGVCMNQYDATLVGVNANDIPKLSRVAVWTRLCLPSTSTITIPKCRMRGDITGDGAWTSADSTILQQYLAGWSIEFDDMQKWCCQVTHSPFSSVNTLDLIDLMRLVQESFTDLTAPTQIVDYYDNWTFSTTTGKWTTDITVASGFDESSIDYPSFITAHSLSGTTLTLTATNPPIADTTLAVNRKTAYIPKGVFYIKKPSYDVESDILTITGYDEMFRTEQVPFEMGTTFTFDEPTLREVALKIVNGTDTTGKIVYADWDGCGIELEDSTQISNTLTMSAIPYGYTVREILRDIAIACGGNWTVAFSGTYPTQVAKLRLVEINQLPTYTFNLLADESDNVLLFGNMGIIV